MPNTQPLISHSLGLLRSSPSHLFATPSILLLRPKMFGVIPDLSLSHTQHLTNSSTNSLAQFSNYIQITMSLAPLLPLVILLPEPPASSQAPSAHYLHSSEWFQTQIRVAQLRAGERGLGVANGVTVVSVSLPPISLPLSPILSLIHSAVSIQASLLLPDRTRHILISGFALVASLSDGLLPELPDQAHIELHTVTFA